MILMRSKSVLFIIALVLILGLSACDASNENAGEVTTTGVMTNSADSETKAAESSTSSDEINTDVSDTQEKVLELIDPEQAKELLDSDQEILLLDVRTQAEYDQVHIPGSTLIPVEELSVRLEDIEEWQDKTVIVYCRSGRRSAAAAKILSEAGFSIVYDLGGIQSWPYETE